MDHHEGREKRLWLVVVLAVASIMIWLYGSIDYTVPPYSQWDLRSYFRMAEAAPGIAANIHQPFIYRLLGPYIVGLLPLAEPLGFRIASTLTALALAALFYLFLGNQDISPILASSSAILLLTNRSLLGYGVWNFFQLNDALSLLYLVGLFWLLEHKSWSWFGGLLLLGALTRETAFLMIPVAAIALLQERASKRDWISLALAVGPGVACFVLVRWLVEPAGGMGLWEALRFHSAKLLAGETWLRLLVTPFMPLTFVPLIFWRASLAFFRQRRWHLLTFVLLVYASALFGQNNERLVAPVSIVYYWLLAQILQETSEYRPPWLLPLTLALAFLGSLHHEYARYPLPSRTLTLLFSLGGLAIVTAAWGYARWCGIRLDPAASKAAPR